MALVLATALPAATIGAQGHPNPTTKKVDVTAVVQAAGGFTLPLINSGQTFDGTTFEGIPDGIGIAPVGSGNRYVDIYVTFEQSHVPFGPPPLTQYADKEDSSVQVARLDLKTRQIISLDEALPPSAGFIRFCSATMAGPAEGFSNYTFFANEESVDWLPTTPGAPNADPAIAPYRQAGLSVWLDTKTGAYKAIPGMGRLNHENTVFVPGGWDDIVSVSGDDTFSAPASQLYMYTAANPGAVKQDKGSLWAFRVTATNGGSVVDEADPFNNANDYLEINTGDDWAGEFILVPPGIAKGTESYGLDINGNPNPPQDSLEAWSNANNVFQFVRIEDLGYDPNNPNVIYFADTGTTRLKESATTGRLFRATATGWPYTDSDGRIFKMELNQNDPKIVDSFSFIAQGRLRLHEEVLPPTTPRTETITVLDAGVGPTFRNPDNIGVGHNSIMVQEDNSTLNAGSLDNAVWQYKFATGGWTEVAVATQTATAETSGVVDASAWLGPGWWLVDVQSHVNLAGSESGPFQWPGPTYPLGPALNSDYFTRREDGQLALLYVPGS
jgi:hypothetical protein